MESPRLATAIAGRSGELAELFTEETGSPIMLSRVYQAVAPSVSLNYYAHLASRHRFEEVRESDLSSLAGGSSGDSIIPRLPPTTSRSRASPRSRRRPWSRGAPSW